MSGNITYTWVTSTDHIHCHVATLQAETPVGTRHCELIILQDKDGGNIRAKYFFYGLKGEGIYPAKPKTFETLEEAKKWLRGQYRAYLAKMNK